jgi:hypothetical protein
MVQAELIHHGGQQRRTYLQGGAVVLKGVVAGPGADQGIKLQ